MLLELTGERVIPQLMKPTNGMLLEHMARYHFSIPYTRGRVLDIACGSGYGAHMIAKACKQALDEMVAVDVDEETIAYALKTYHHQRISFQQQDALDAELPQKLGLFDTILSFETIEHVPDEARFMKNLYDMLKPGGTLILSTPFGIGRGKPCRTPFHVHQLTQQEFRELFVAYSEVEFYYQRGLVFETVQKEGVRYPSGIALCTK